MKSSDLNNATAEQQGQAVTDIMCGRRLKSERCVCSFSTAILLPFFNLKKIKVGTVCQQEEKQ